MDQVQSVLLVLLAVGFLILLVVAIIAAFVVFKILSNIRRITQRLDETSENMGDMVKYMGRKLGPAAASAVGSVLLRRVKSSFKRK